MPLAPRHGGNDSAVGELLKRHPARVSEEIFILRQFRARDLFVHWLSPEAFFRHLHRHFDPGAPLPASQP